MAFPLEAQKALNKQRCRAKKIAIRNKAARIKRKPPTNKPEHSIKESHKPKAPSSVKNTHSYKGLTREIEKVFMEQKQAIEIWYYYVMQSLYNGPDDSEDSEDLVDLDASRGLDNLVDKHVKIRAQLSL
jgi:hypothetical protein